MNFDNISAYIVIVMKKHYTEEEKKFVNHMKLCFSCFALNFIENLKVPSITAVLYELYKGHCVRETLLSNFHIKNWFDDDILINRLIPIVHSLVDTENKVYIASFLRMIYFHELINYNTTDEYMYYVNCYFNVFSCNIDGGTDIYRRNKYFKQEYTG